MKWIPAGIVYEFIPKKGVVIYGTMIYIGELKRPGRETLRDTVRYGPFFERRLERVVKRAERRMQAACNRLNAG